MRVTDRYALPAGNPLSVLVTDREVHVVGISRERAAHLLRDALRSISCPTCGGTGESTDCCPGAIEDCDACSGSGVARSG